ncbi:hypothetical protein Tco_0144467 [Tanacetum coccineum]
MIKKVRITRCLLWNYGWCLTLAASNALENSSSECMVSSGYAGSGIDHYTFSCDELALIRRIFFVGYGV